MINVKSALRKFDLKKSEFDQMKLGFISAPNSYYSNKPMRLYYEFQIEEMININKEREISKVEEAKNKEISKSFKKLHSYSEKLTKNLLALQASFSAKNEYGVFEKYVMNHYLHKDPFMQKFLERKCPKMTEDELLFRLYENSEPPNIIERKTTLPKNEFYEENNENLTLRKHLDNKKMFDAGRKNRKRTKNGKDCYSSIDEQDLNEEQLLELASNTKRAKTRRMSKDRTSSSTSSSSDDSENDFVLNVEPNIDYKKFCQENSSLIKDIENEESKKMSIEPPKSNHF